MRVAHSHHSYTLKLTTDRSKTAFLQHIMNHPEITSSEGIQLRVRQGDLKFVIRKSNNADSAMVQGILRIEATEVEVID